MTNWRPGMPFRYYDPTRQVLMAMRMDACSWGVSQEQAAFVTEGLWNGFSNGTVSLPSNVIGNSSPDKDSASGRCRRKRRTGISRWWRRWRPYFSSSPHGWQRGQ